MYCVPPYMCICKQLPSNQHFDKKIFSHQKGGGVSRWVNGSERQMFTSLMHVMYLFSTCTCLYRLCIQN